jgi:glucosylceramidase
MAVLLVMNSLCSFGCSKSGSGTGDAVTVPDTTPVATDPVSPLAELWLTTADHSVLFQRQSGVLGFSASPGQGSTITVDSARSYQSIDGFGYCLTGGSAYLIHQLADEPRGALLHELFDIDSTAIGVSYLRITIGASDLSRKVFSYDDMPAGETDTTLSRFNLGPDTTDLIPLLKEILAINPDITILATPWSAPAWMKTNGSPIGGSLRKKYDGVYADYLVTYIRQMAAKGIHVAAITPQNEPLNPNNNPSMVMEASEEADFISGYLGPAVKAAGLDTRIIIYDHNCDRPDYPLTILKDPAANPFVDGSAFHLYAGTIDALSEVHDAFPGKKIYFTEQYTGGPGNFSGDLSWHVKNLIIGATRNWSSNVIEWNLASDPAYEPHTPGGCTNCMGALTIGPAVTRNVSYYVIASASKFVRPGSRRIASDITGSLENVAFLRPDGKKVLIVLNDADVSATFNIAFDGRYMHTQLRPHAVGTYIW